MKPEQLASVSHELRSPLNAILGYSEALKDGLMGPLSDEQRKCAGEIFASGQRLLSLIGNVMDRLRIDAGVTAPEPGAADLNGLLSNAAAIPPARGAGAAIAAAAGSGKRIALVIEDDYRAADLVRLLLEAEGFNVLRAASAEEALLMAPRQALSLITLDLQLRGISGWGFLKRIRENDALAGVPVVIISGQPVSNLALGYGAAAMLQKPFGRDQLKASLAHLGLQQA